MNVGHDFENRYFDSAYGKLHYARHIGPGPSVVFLHGFAGSTRSWGRLVEYLPEEFNVYLVDLLGHGESDAPDVDYSLKMHYETVLGLVEHEGLSNHYLFGHSYGGWIAAYYAIEERLAGIVLEDSAGLREFAEARNMENPGYREEMVKRAVQINPHETVLRKMLEADNEGTYLTPSNLGKIDSRALIIWGGNDTTIGLEYSRIFNKSIRGSRMVVLEAERHTPHYSNPQAVAKLLIDFVKG